MNAVIDVLKNSPTGNKLSDYIDEDTYYRYRAQGLSSEEIMKKVMPSVEFNSKKGVAAQTIMQLFQDVSYKQITKYFDLVYAKETNKYPIEYFQSLGYTYSPIQ